MKTIGIVYHPNGRTRLGWLSSCRLSRAQTAFAIWQGSADELARCGLASKLEIVFTLGGDGTIVRTVRAVAGSGVPVLGVNLGRLGFSG